MAKFADYGFNKSHAAAYALVAYQTAWMKANHPVGVHRRLHEPGARQHRPAGGAAAGGGRARASRILPPDINRSGADFSVERADGRQAGDPLRAGGGEEGRLRRDAGAGGGARRRGRSPTSRISPRASIRASSTGCSSRTWSAPAPSTRWSRTARGCSPAPRRSCAARRPRRRRRRAARSACSAAAGDAGAAAPARHAGLAADGAARLRGGGDRLPPHRASARRLRPGAAPARRDAVQRRWRRSAQARRRRG